MRQRAHDEKLRQLLALQDRERRLLACEIHDGFVQDVVAAQMAIDAFLEQLLARDPDLVDSLLRIRALVRNAIDEARSLVGDLRPPLVDDLTLADAIQFVVQQATTQRKLQIKFTHNLEALRLEPLLQSTIIRVVHEALNNVAAHAGTKKATVQAKIIGGDLRVTISDRGTGFDPTKVPAQRFGLSGIRERARLFGGKALIQSEMGKGTRIRVEFPLPAEK
jgi:signal transduction histidine kinase